MWSITNHTPYKADSTWGRDRDGVHEWIVAVKATYDIAPDGTLSLADEQLDPLLVPEYLGEPGASSLRYDADLVSPKPTTDVVLNATAYAPDARPSTGFLVSAQVGRMQKVIRVTGERWWQRSAIGMVASAMAPVRRVPIVYERAYGGYDARDPDPRHQRMDARNPVGCGVVGVLDHVDGEPLPNVEFTDRSLESGGPAGFGAIDSFWTPRRELQGTYDEKWERDRRPLLPEDWDPRSLQCAPVDQQAAAHLHGGEAVELINLTPNGLLRFALPKVHLTFATRIDGRIEQHRARLSTVIVEPDLPRVSLVWLTALAVRNDGDYLEETVIREKPFR